MCVVEWLDAFAIENLINDNFSCSIMFQQEFPYLGAFLRIYCQIVR